MNNEINGLVYIKGHQREFGLESGFQEKEEKIMFPDNDLRTSDAKAMEKHCELLNIDTGVRDDVICSYGIEGFHYWSSREWTKTRRTLPVIRKSGVLLARTIGASGAGCCSFDDAMRLSRILKQVCPTSLDGSRLV